LPEAADELRLVAKALESPNAQLLLGESATERALRKVPLNDYQVISFASHAVVAGEIDGVTEPALVLTPGADEGNQSNDGLLTANEIANLPLDANLVILSACNTAAPDGRTGGRGLSGLADAFFYAGARSIAVTQWSVISQAAKTIGAGLVSRSIASRVGVSQGLREAMSEYVFSSKEDYLAHPRFWGAFVIGGDGAVQPLSSSNTSETTTPKVVLEWEHIFKERVEDEFVGLAKGPKSVTAIGVHRPEPGGRRAGRYLVDINSNGNIEMLSRQPDLAGTDVASSSGRLFVLGYRASDTKSTAIFQVYHGSQELWNYEVDSDRWNIPIGLVELDESYMLLSLENDYAEGSQRGSILLLTKVTRSGGLLAQQKYFLPVRRAHSTQNRIAVDRKGQLTVAIVGNLPTNPGPTMWINPRTASKNFCSITPTSVLLKLDATSLQEKQRVQLGDTSIAAIRQDNVQRYTAYDINSNCNVEKSVKVGILTDTLDIEPLFDMQNTNNVHLGDFIVQPSYFVLTGRAQTFLPTALTRDALSPEEFSTGKWFNPWDESFWEKNDEQGSAFVMVVRKDGRKVADRVFSDMRNRYIAGITAVGPGRYVAAGQAFGDRGWALGLKIDETRMSPYEPGKQ
jgi:hypothetical protein